MQPFLRELFNQRLQQLAAAARDLGGQVAVAEAGAGKAEIAVERVDEDLEAGLPRLILGAQLLGRGGAGELLAVQPVVAQPASAAG